MTPTPQHRVAVVIPCFDDGETLPEAVDSVRAQNEECELVVIDDGSSDAHTLDVLAKLESDGVRVLRQENAGPGAARNAGLAATSAPYVIPLDADDRLPAGAISALADALDADTRLALAWGDVEVFGERSAVMRKAETLDAWLITYVNEVPIASLVRRRDLVAVGGWRARGYEDWALWMALAERGARGSRLPVTTLQYRVHGERNGDRDFADQARLDGELRRSHGGLYARRRLEWRRSSAPWLLRLTLPAIERLPVSVQRRQALVWLAADTAYGRFRATAPTRLRHLADRFAPLRARLTHTVRSPR